VRKMPRYSLDITAEERDQLKKLAKASERSMAGMMRIVFRRGLQASIPAPRQTEIGTEAPG